MADENDPKAWGDGYRAGYDQALKDVKSKLEEVSTWCEKHGFGARARHTRSAMARVDMVDFSAPDIEPAKEPR